MSVVKVRAGKPYPGFMSSYFEYDTFVGDIIPNPKWVHTDCMVLTTGDSFFPFRVIKKADVVSIDNEDFKTEQASKPSYQEFQIPGSNGSLYCVTANNDVWSCECKGFQFRRTCKHVGEAKAQLQA
jgi:hypothetical protein